MFIQKLYKKTKVSRNYKSPCKLTM